MNRLRKFTSIRAGAGPALAVALSIAAFGSLPLAAFGAEHGHSATGAAHGGARGAALRAGWRGGDGRFEHGWHGGRFGWWWVGPAGAWTWYAYNPYYYPGYPYPYYYGYPPGYAYPPAEAPSVGSLPAPPQVWYYCDASKAYYPQVPSCPGGWRAMPANPGPGPGHAPPPPGSEPPAVAPQ